MSSRLWRTVLLLAGIAAGIWSATRVRVPSEAGFREAANYLHEQAPAEPVLYDGYHDGVIGFYIRARDPRFEGRLILGQQLLYHYGPSTSFDYIETSRAVSTDDVVSTGTGLGVPIHRYRNRFALHLGPVTAAAQGIGGQTRVQTGTLFSGNLGHRATHRRLPVPVARSTRRYCRFTTAVVQ